VAPRNISGLWDVIQSNGFVVPIKVKDFKPDGSYGLEAEQGEGDVTGNGGGHVNAT
jgi:hypothetical protein